MSLTRNGRINICEYFLRKISLCKMANRNCLSLPHLIRNWELDFRNVLTRTNTWCSKYQIEHQGYVSVKTFQ